MLEILKQPVPIFYKDDAGGKRHNIHVQCCIQTGERFENNNIQFTLMLLNSENVWIPCVDQSIFHLCGTVNITFSACIDIHFTVHHVSYRYNNKPFGLRICIGDESVTTSPFHVKSKSATRRRIVQHKQNTQQLNKSIQSALSSIRKTNINITKCLLLIQRSTKEYFGKPDTIESWDVAESLSIDDDSQPILPQIQPILPQIQPLTENISPQFFNF